LQGFWGFDLNKVSILKAKIADPAPAWRSLTLASALATLATLAALLVLSRSYAGLRFDAALGAVRAHGEYQGLVLDLQGSATVATSLIEREGAFFVKTYTEIIQGQQPLLQRSTPRQSESQFQHALPFSTFTIRREIATPNQGFTEVELIMSKHVMGGILLIALAIGLSVGFVIQQLRGRAVQHRERQEAMVLRRIADQVAHDIRPPLGALKAVAAVAENLSPDLRSMMSDAVKRIQDVSDELTENAGRNAESASTPVARLVSTVKSVWSEKLTTINGQKAIEMTLEVAPDALPRRLPLGPATWSRITSNLIQNSIEAIPERGAIKVAITPAESGSGVEFVVADSGLGMDAPTAAQAGTRGFSSGKSGGSGLGLSFARDMIEQAGGSVAVESAPGMGTQVKIRV
jgi:signal transduction histidine kinase